MTAVYTEGGLNPLFKCVSQWQKLVKVAKKQRLQWFPHICHSAKCECSSSSHWCTV